MQTARKIKGVSTLQAGKLAPIFTVLSAEKNIQNRTFPRKCIRWSDLVSTCQGDLLVYIVYPVRLTR